MRLAELGPSHGCTTLKAVENKEENAVVRANVRRRRLQKVLWILGATGVLMALDVALDVMAGAPPIHAWLEAFLAIMAVYGAGQVVRELQHVAYEAQRELDEMKVTLADVHADAERWRAEAQDLMKGLGEAIDGQFEAWALTPAEKEVGLLLLKGLTFKEVAQVRATSDATVRQQANKLYQKAELGGRAELSAFFLEDLLLPPPTSTSDDG